MTGLKLLILMPTRYLGNMVIAMQAIVAILEKYGAGDVTVITDDNLEGLARLCLHDRCTLVVYPRRMLRQGNSLMTRAKAYFSFVKKLRRIRYDIALDIDGSSVSGTLTRLARAQEKIGPDFSYQPSAYTRTIAINRNAQHCFKDFVDMAGAIGVELGASEYFKLPVATGCGPIESQLDDKPLACIHPCATKHYKQWGIDKFADLADQLVSRGWQVAIVGAGAGERASVEAMMAKMRQRAIDAHSRLELHELVALLQRARLFVGNDSGPMHLASATGVNVLALFGPTELFRWQPRAPNTSIITGMPCAPECRTEACTQSWRCMRSITVDQVMTAALRYA